VFVLNYEFPINTPIHVCFRTHIYRAPVFVPILDSVLFSLIERGNKYGREVFPPVSIGTQNQGYPYYSMKARCPCGDL
jgi:hypothetical protein